MSIGVIAGTGPSDGGPRWTGQACYHHDKELRQTRIRKRGYIHCRTCGKRDYGDGKGWR